jgi:DnaJ family protein C protein 3
MSALKQCMHFDPDSKPCLSAHRLAKSFDKTFAKIDKAIAAEDWRGVITLIMGSDKNHPLGGGFLRTYHEAMEENTSPSALSSPSSSPIQFPLPSATKQSPRRRDLLRALCRAYTHTQNYRAGERWYDALLAMDGGVDDVDGLVGKGEAMLKREEWEEAVRLLERAFEASERSDRDVRSAFHGFR